MWLLLAMALLASVIDIVRDVEARMAAARASHATLPRRCCRPSSSRWLHGGPRRASGRCWAQSLLTLAIVTPLGPLVYRLAYEKLADATVLVLLIVSVGVHFALTGLGLVFFGAEGFRNPSFWDARFAIGAVSLSGQTLIIFIASIVLIDRAVRCSSSRTLCGKALRATAVNRLGARLDGHLDAARAGRLSFGLAAFIGALSGLLIGPTTTMFYDSGFLIGLKGFVAAIFGGAGELPGRRHRRAVRRPARIVRLVLGQRVQGSDRLHR